MRRERDRSKFPAVPREFREELEDAARSKLVGKLALLADEIKGSSWESEGLRMVAREQVRAQAFEGAAATTPHTILFTGHQVDAPGRKERRFPPDKEPLGRAAIRDAVEREAARHGGAVGIAGAASGGDIVFHEVCAELGIPTRLYLALPPDSYVKESVAPAGGDWVRRFYKVQARFPSVPVLARTKERPGWLRHRPDYSIWQRNNLWILNEALAAGARNVTLIALWNGRTGDGPGGTADMIRIARERGAETRVLDSNAIFGLTAATAATKA